MLNRIYLIIENNDSRSPLPEESNIFFSYAVHRPSGENLTHIYRDTERSGKGGHVLTLDIDEMIPDREALTAIASFLFRPGYVYKENRPLISLTGESVAMVKETAAVLSDFLRRQGFDAVLIHLILSEAWGNGLDETRNSRLFHSRVELTEFYHRLLFDERQYGRDVFFRPSSEEEAASALIDLKNVETLFREQRPREYDLIRYILEQEEASRLLAVKNTRLLAELANQQQYVTSLRSNHAAREIQDYYNREYEILPLWYKRFGHIIKVVTGKRTFRSLYRDDVKKYKD